MFTGPAIISVLAAFGAGYQCSVGSSVYHSEHNRSGGNTMKGTRSFLLSSHPSTRDSKPSRHSLSEARHATESDAAVSCLVRSAESSPHICCAPFPRLR